MPACADDGEWEAIRDENVPAVPEAFASFGSMPAAAPAAQAGADSTSTAWASDLQLTVNAKLYTIQNPDPSLLLVDYLRDHLKLTGTKIGCGEGGCGACTVMLEWTDGESGQTVRKSINSCLRPLAACDGCTVTTVEGIGGLRHAHGYSPIQTKLASCNGSQCGYCSPGWVMSMYGLLANDAAPSPKQIEDHFDGNICRCTGYRPIMSAFKSLPFDSQLTAAPSATVAQRALHFSSPSFSFYKVLTMEQFFEAQADALANDPASDIRIVVGNSSLGIEKYYKPSTAPNSGTTVVIAVAAVPDLCTVKVSSDGVIAGAAVTINDLIEALHTFATNYPQSSAVLAGTNLPIKATALADHLERVANNQVRNVGSWAGNLCITKGRPDFPSDLRTILTAAGASMMIIDAAQQRSTVSVEQFLDLDMTGKIIQGLFVPLDQTKQAVLFDTYKVATRCENAHAVINAGFQFTMQAGSSMVSAASITYGGLQKASLFHPAQTEAYLTGRPINGDTLKAAAAILQAELSKAEKPIFDGVSQSYRVSLSMTLFYKFFLACQPAAALPADLQSAALPYLRPVSSGEEKYNPEDPSVSPVSKAVPKLRALEQTSGEAVYTMDEPFPSNTLFGAVVLSSMPLATILSMDAKAALAMTGVVDFITAEDIPAAGANNVTSQIPGAGRPGSDGDAIEEIFASKAVYCVGQQLGLILADTLAHAQAAAKFVQVSYGPAPVDPATGKPGVPIFSLEDAIAKGDFVDTEGKAHMASIGVPVKEVHAALAPAAGKHVLTDRAVIAGAQKHFFMETHTTACMPTEGGNYSIITSSQWPQLTAGSVAAAIGIPINKVTATTKRAGGGFGGKITRQLPLATAVAVACAKHGVPVASQNERITDMKSFGGREPMLAKYSVSFDDNGVVSALWFRMYIDMGWSYDCSGGDSNMAILWADNAYFVPTFRSEAHILKTNNPTNTACRSPGNVHSIFVREAVMEDIACALGISPDHVRAANFYQDGDLTPYGQKITNFRLPSLWSSIMDQCDYTARSAAVDAFNAANRWRKKGIMCSPLKYGIGLGGVTAGAKVSAYSDGTVGVSHTGCEVGQGIHTKVAQTVAYALGIPLSSVVVGATATDVFPNGPATGGSTTSETCCGAALDACKALNDQLAPVKAKNPTLAWEALVQAGMGAGLSLVALGWFGDPPPADVSESFTYSTYGVAVSEVEIDVLTGQPELLRTDLLLDLGRSINPDVDIGQIEGGFIQGVGLFMLEKVTTDESNGQQVSLGTWDYKPPALKSIPVQLNVTLADSGLNPSPLSVLGSKAVGEPPFTLSNSVFFAITRAIKAARVQGGQSPHFDFEAPLTCEKIQQACGVTSTQFSLDKL